MPYFILSINPRQFYPQSTSYPGALRQFSIAVALPARAERTLLNFLCSCLTCIFCPPECSRTRHESRTTFNFLGVPGRLIFHVIKAPGYEADPQSRGSITTITNVTYFPEGSINSALFPMRRLPGTQTICSHFACEVQDKTSRVNCPRQ